MGPKAVEACLRLLNHTWEFPMLLDSYQQILTHMTQRPNIPSPGVITGTTPSIPKLNPLFQAATLSSRFHPLSPLSLRQRHTPEVPKSDHHISLSLNTSKAAPHSHMVVVMV